MLTQKSNNLNLKPYYEGFTGTIQKIEEDRYLFKGVYRVIDKDTIQIIELPIGIWTEKYKMFLEKLIDHTDKNGKKIKSIVKDYKDMSTDTVVDITVMLNRNTLEPLLNTPDEYGCNKLEKLLNLTTTHKTTNMHMFDETQRLRKFSTPEDIIQHYIPIRLDFYQKRKNYLIQNLKLEVCILSNKARFIEEQCNDTIDLRRKKKSQVIELLQMRKYDHIDGDLDYKYLRTMQIDSVIEENRLRLLSERDLCKKKLKIVQTITKEKMWYRELNELSVEYEKYKRNRYARQRGVEVKKRKKKVKRTKKRIPCK